jgi:hypothetical protein
LAGDLGVNTVIKVSQSEVEEKILYVTFTSLYDGFSLEVSTAMWILERE